MPEGHDGRVVGQVSEYVVRMPGEFIADGAGNARRVIPCETVERLVNDLSFEAGVRLQTKRIQKL